MESTQVTMRPKKWFRIINYIASIACIFLFSYILYKIFNAGSKDPIILSIILSTVCIVGLILTILLLPNIHKSRIEIHSDSLSRYGLITKKISFEEVDKIIVRKGGIEVHGQGFFNVINFGDLHENFDEALKSLSKHLPNPDEIKFRGKDEYINRFLGYRATD